MEKILEITLLYDFYGELLTEKQKTVMEMYHLDDYSLQEVADEFHITRQAVHDMIKRTEKLLFQYENRLGLVNRFVEQKKNLAIAVEKLDKAVEENNLTDKAAFVEIKQILSDLVD